MVDPGEGFTRRVSLENLDDFAPLLRPMRAENDEPETEDATAGDLDEANRDRPKDAAVAAAEELFNGERLNVPVDYRRPARRRAEPRQPQAGTGEGHEGRPLLWRKGPLPASDVQRQTGHPTGGVRLVQAGFQGTDGEVIDQTTYFRDSVFGDLDWSVEREEPLREVASADFEVVILDDDHGIHQLQVSHKPSGEASQGNYTTLLHWGVLGDTVRRLNLIGSTLSIYGPRIGTNEPYLLEIA